MTEVIKERLDLCVGCNRCVRECSMETANITYQDELGNIKVKIDHEKCITCGLCVETCKHDARYFTDDTERLFDDLSNGVQISFMAAPSIKTNIPYYKNLFTFLKQLGAKKIYDVSLGADICVWAHIKHLNNNGKAPIITQPCPAIVNYCELYRHELLESLSPVHSPMACTSIYMKEYKGINDRIAALSPCMAKSDEFERTGLADYNITFKKLLEYLKKNNIMLPQEETEFDHAQTGLGTLFPMPGGFKENLEYLLGKNLHIAKAEGFNVYDKLDQYSRTPQEFLPDIYDVLSCAEGCNIGTASLRDRCLFAIDKKMKNDGRKVMDESKKKHYESVYKTYDDTLDITRFKRKYNAIHANFPKITNSDIGKAFELLGKTEYENQHIDCFACGSKTCHDMARKIALNINIPNNCIIKAKEDARIEHEEKLRAQAHQIEMEKKHETDERIRKMFDSTPFAAHFWDENFNMTDCNQAASDMFNLENKHEYIKKYFDYMPEYQSDGTKSTDKVKQIIEKTFETGYQRAELNCLSPEGELMPVEDTYVRVDYKGTKIVAGYSRDLREHKRMLYEIEASAMENEIQLAKMNLIIKATQIALWEMHVLKDDPVNPRNKIIFSDDFRAMLGYKDETDFPNILESWSDKIHPEDKEKTLKDFAAHMVDITGKTPYDAEYRLLKKNGEYAYFRAAGETTRDKNGNPIRVAGSLIDMTVLKNLINEAERQRAEAEIANKAKSEFLSHISHEIRTPMNAVLGTAEIQLQKENISPEMEEAFNMIYSSGNLLLNIINDILDLSKIEAGKLEIIPAQYDIPSIIYDTVQLNLLRYDSKPIEFELIVDKNTPLDMFGDELRIKQILNNILSNSFKYTEKGKVILAVRAEDLKGKDETIKNPELQKKFERRKYERSKCILIISVKDTGQGMTKEQVAQLFEEYTRFNIDTNRTVVGTGLGMHITKRLIDSMNGKIIVESEPGKGSEFTIYLPQERYGDTICGEEMADQLRNSRFKSMVKLNRAQLVHEYMPYGSVLIVDDVESNLYVAKGLMLPYGVKIDTVSSGFEAIEKVKSGNVYDIIFMDHMMPKMNGLDATKIIRSMGYENPIVALTANAVTGSSAMFINNGFDGFISKPIDIRELNSSLNRLIRDKQPAELIEAARIKMVQKTPVAAIVKKAALSSDLIRSIVRDIESALVILEGLLPKIETLDENETLIYITTVHGMKSVLLNVGETDLSITALGLEKAGDSGRMKEIITGTQPFIDALKSVIEKHKSKAEEKNNTISQDDMVFLKEKLAVIITACENIKKKDAKTALNDLKQKTWPDRIDELFEEISLNLLHGEFKKVISAIENSSF